MNKKVLALLLVSIVATTISACSNKNSIDVPKNNTQTKIEEKSGPKTEEKVEGKTEIKKGDPNRYSVAGIDDADEFDRVFKTIQELVAKGEKEKVAEYIKYPLTSANINVNSKDEFVKNYDLIITEKVKNALVNQKNEKLFVNYKGVMVGDGEVWFGIFDNGSSSVSKYLIYGINQPK
ncbi:hypothetical protein LGK97_06085 [Clostridium sp. CS001]|uniref:hypothetical protein n=1 Tax=Clostridium sp. CS001 TaxID=2880648 RepID=UPI001CF21E46|nr:hypothetical protein [Clostridium sp. CS001]MCB2289333.1 hypothetical protein [Clostridium sp. CS001]